MKRLRLLGAAWMLLASAISAPAQALDPLGRLFPPSSGYVAEVGKDVMADEARTYLGVVLRSSSAAIAIDEITFGLTDAAQIAVYMKHVTVKPNDPTAPIMLFADVRLQLADWPSHAKSICGVASVVRKVEIGAMEYRFTQDQDRLKGMRLRSLLYEHRADAAECWVAGLAAIDDIELQMRDETSLSSNGIRAEIRLPLTAEASVMPISGPAAVRAQIGEIEILNSGKSPAFGFGDVTASIDFDSKSLRGILQVISASQFTGAKANGQLNLMQMFNGLSLVTADIQINAPITRIYSAGVVPSEAVTNFSRVGLSTVTGTSSYLIRMAAGTIGIEAKIGLIGLIESAIAVQADMRPYALQKLQAAASGVDLGAHLIPDVALLGAKLKYEDRGFEGYVMDLTGVPSGRYIQEFAALMGDAGSTRINAPILGLSSGLSEFFRYAANGYIMHVEASPPSRVNIARASLLALTDTDGLVSALGISQAHERPEGKSE